MYWDVCGQEFKFDDEAVEEGCFKVEFAEEPKGDL